MYCILKVILRQTNKDYLQRTKLKRSCTYYKMTKYYPCCLALLLQNSFLRRHLAAAHISWYDTEACALILVLISLYKVITTGTNVVYYSLACMNGLWLVGSQWLDQYVRVPVPNKFPIYYLFMIGESRRYFLVFFMYISLEQYNTECRKLPMKTSLNRLNRLQYMHTQRDRERQGYSIPSLGVLRQLFSEELSWLWRMVRSKEQYTIIVWDIFVWMAKKSRQKFSSRQTVIPLTWWSKQQWKHSVRSAP